MYSGGTKEGELQRSAELYIDINTQRGPYFALAFLYDAQYGRDEIKRIMEIIIERKLQERTYK